MTAMKLMVVCSVLAAMTAPMWAAPRAKRDAPPPTAETSLGTYEGHVLADGDIEAFEGVAYAANAAENRFQAPQPPAAFDGTRPATQRNPGCIQDLDNDGIDVPQQEDCLFLNIFRNPASKGKSKGKSSKGKSSEGKSSKGKSSKGKSSKSKSSSKGKSSESSEAGLPVMVWIHGGSFTSGSGANYNPQFILAANDVILVTVNYRLGALGFLKADGVPDNLGLRDVIAALEFIQEHIADFGGDPEQVTLFGESAGAAVISALSLSPVVLGRGLFQAVIQQSAAATNWWATDANALVFPIDDHDAFLQNVNCVNVPSTTECLDSVPVELIRSASIQFGWAPTIGGEILPATPLALAPQRDPSLKVFIGVNKDEMALFYRNAIDFFNGKNESSGVCLQLAGQAGFLSATAANENYPRDPDAPFGCIQQIVDIVSDFFFHLGIVRDVREWQNIGVNPYLYQLDYVPDSFPWPTSAALNGAEYRGVFHVMGVFYQFKGEEARWSANNGAIQYGNWTKDATDESVVSAVTEAFTSFAVDGVPSVAGLAVPAAATPDTAQMPYLSFDAPSTIKIGFNDRSQQGQFDNFEGLIQ